VTSPDGSSDAAGRAALGSRASAKGIACGIGAGALWGLVFVAPEWVRDFSALHLSTGRYLGYGLVAAMLLAPRWRAVRPHIGTGQWKDLTWLSIAGNTLYYLLLTTAVQTGGIAMTSLIIGFMPVAVTIIGSRDEGAVPLRRLVPSLLLCAAGTLCIGAQALDGQQDGSTGQRVIGLLCAIGALASWTSYAIGNARCLRRLPRVSAHDWNLLTGVVTGLQSLVLIPVALALDASHHEAGAWLRLGAVSAAVAVFASLLGNALWNQMSRLLPLTLVGQMILCETVFALLYGMLWERRLPTPLETTALACVTLSVLSCVAAHRRPVAVEVTA